MQGITKKLKNKQKGFKGRKGITLIALIITIIVLLILAGVSIATLTGENGILTRAHEAKTSTEKSQEKEGLELAVISSQMTEANTLEIKKENLENAIKEQFGNNKDFTVTNNGDGSFLVNMDDTNRIYYVDDTGEVITEENILRISTVDELKAFRDDVNNGNSYDGWYVYLANDITLDIREEWEAIGYIDPNYDAKNPEEEINKPFRGIFDGCEHEIDNVLLYRGIFGMVIDGKIKNVSLGQNSSSADSVDGSIAGGIVSNMYGNSIISNCKNYANLGKVRGGVVGFVAGSVTIENCINYGNLENAYGGVVGNSNGTDWEQFKDVENTIINCGNYGNITKNQNNEFLGGIVGYFKGTISNSFNVGNVTMNFNKNNVGGIVGDISGKILNCYNTGNVSGYYCVGGIVGYVSQDRDSLFENCYNIGDVQGYNNATSIGQLIGRNQSGTQIKNSYTKNDTFTYKELGSAFKEDVNNINRGYPILSWQ